MASNGPSSDVPPMAIIGCLTVDSVISANGDLIRRVCGGNALYASVGAHIWDSRVGLVTRAGEDYPAGCLQDIAAALDARGLRRIPGSHPVRVAFAYRPDGSRSRQIPEAMLAELPEDVRPDFIDNTHDTEIYLAGTPTPDDIPGSWLAGVDSVHLPALLIQSHEQLVNALRAARPDRLITVDSPWYDRRNTTSDEHVDLLRKIDVVLPSEEDLELYRPGVPVIDAARQLIEYGSHGVVVKIGADGSLVFDSKGKITHVPAYAVNAVDPTGAGDSFCGGFLVGLRETGDLVQAAL
jgi:sugar/nucleoside kinase (ribokinase family)